MCICEVLGGNKYQRELAHCVINHCVNTLIPMSYRLDITVRIRSFKQHPDQNLYALCEHIDHSEYLIQINRSLDAQTFVQYLCHEMVHVMQYQLGNLQEVHDATVPGTVIWMGQQLQEQDFAYTDMPWEAQAFELQESLTADFFAEFVNLSEHSFNFKHLADQLIS